MMETKSSNLRIEDWPSLVYRCYCNGQRTAVSLTCERIRTFLGCFYSRQLLPSWIRTTTLSSSLWIFQWNKSCTLLLCVILKALALPDGNFCNALLESTICYIPVFALYVGIEKKSNNNFSIDSFDVHQASGAKNWEMPKIETKKIFSTNTTSTEHNIPSQSSHPIQLMNITNEAPT